MGGGGGPLGWRRGARWQIGQVVVVVVIVVGDDRRRVVRNVVG